jgi:hypothetical protein
VPCLAFLALEQALDLAGVEEVLVALVPVGCVRTGVLRNRTFAISPFGHVFLALEYPASIGVRIAHFHQNACFGESVRDALAGPAECSLDVRSSVASNRVGGAQLLGYALCLSTLEREQDFFRDR